MGIKLLNYEEAYKGMSDFKFNNESDKEVAAINLCWQHNRIRARYYDVSLDMMYQHSIILNRLCTSSGTRECYVRYTDFKTGEIYEEYMRWYGEIDNCFIKRLGVIRIAEKIIEQKNEEEKKNMSTIDSRKILNDVAANCNNRHVLKDYYASIGLGDHPVSRSLFMGIDITDVKVYNDRAVLVYFSDGTFTKSECQKDEVFSLDTGIAICLCKKLLSKGGQDGHKAFNNAIRKAHKVMKKNELDKAREEVRKAEEKKRNAKAIERSKRRKERAALRQMEIQKHAYLQAVHELNSETKKSKIKECLDKLNKEKVTK